MQEASFRQVTEGNEEVARCLLSTPQSSLPDVPEGFPDCQSDSRFSQLRGTVRRCRRALTDKITSDSKVPKPLSLLSNNRRGGHLLRRKEGSRVNHHFSFPFFKSHLRALSLPWSQGTGMPENPKGTCAISLTNIIKKEISCGKSGKRERWRGQAQLSSQQLFADIINKFSSEVAIKQILPLGKLFNSHRNSCNQTKIRTEGGFTLDISSWSF